jgi:hypothetical protein
MCQLQNYIEADLQHINCTFKDNLALTFTASVSKLYKNEKQYFKIKGSLVSCSRKRLTKIYPNRCIWQCNFAIKDRRSYRKWIQIPLSNIYKQLNYNNQFSSSDSDTQSETESCSSSQTESEIYE